MANFQQHVTCSTVTGIVIGSGAFLLGVPLTSSIVAAGLCSMAGMLPDIDSKTSKSFRECIWSAAGLASMLVATRLSEFEFSQEFNIICGVSIFLLMRTVLGWLLCKFTVHRGMIHSIPAAVIAAEITYLLSGGPTELRIFKSLALMAGFLSHLIMDELYSITTVPGQRIKRSFGTALKMIDYKQFQPTVITYICLIGTTAVIMNESLVLERMEANSTKLNNFLYQVSQKTWQIGDEVPENEENNQNDRFFDQRGTEVVVSESIENQLKENEEAALPRFWRRNRNRTRTETQSEITIPIQEHDMNVLYGSVRKNETQTGTTNTQSPPSPAPSTPNLPYLDRAPRSLF